MKQTINIHTDAGNLTFEICPTCDGHGFDENGSTCENCKSHHYVHPDVTWLTRDEYVQFRSRVRLEAEKSCAIEDELRKQIRNLEKRLADQHKITTAMWDADGTDNDYQHNPINGRDYPGHWERVEDDPKWQDVIDALPSDHPYARKTKAAS